MAQPDFRVTGKEHLSNLLKAEGGYISISNSCEVTVFLRSSAIPTPFLQWFRFTGGWNDFCVFRKWSSALIQSSPCLAYLQGLSQGSLDLKTCLSCLISEGSTVGLAVSKDLDVLSHWGGCKELQQLSTGTTTSGQSRLKISSSFSWFLLQVRKLKNRTTQVIHLIKQRFLGKSLWKISFETYLEASFLPQWS